MYASNSEQGVNARGLAQRMRERARETGDPFYRRMFEYAALDLESEAERRERAARRSH